MLTQHDIQVLKEVFVTKDEFKEMSNKITELESLITQGFKELVDLYNESIRETDDYATTMKMQIPVIREHEKRISVLEEKCD